MAALKRSFLSRSYIAWPGVPDRCVPTCRIDVHRVFTRAICSNSAKPAIYMRAGRIYIRVAGVHAANCARVHLHNNHVRKSPSVITPSGSRFQADRLPPRIFLHFPSYRPSLRECCELLYSLQLTPKFSSSDVQTNVGYAYGSDQDNIRDGIAVFLFW